MKSQPSASLRSICRTNSLVAWAALLVGSGFYFGELAQADGVQRLTCSGNGRAGSYVLEGAFKAIHVDQQDHHGMTITQNFEVEWIAGTIHRLEYRSGKLTPILVDTFDVVTASKSHGQAMSCEAGCHDDWLRLDASNAQRSFYFRVNSSNSGPSIGHFGTPRGDYDSIACDPFLVINQ